jgi:hypothetical protein
MGCDEQEHLSLELPRPARRRARQTPVKDVLRRRGHGQGLDMPSYTGRMYYLGLIRAHDFSGHKR